MDTWPQPRNTNTEFELRGFNHVAFVCRDMAETVAWYEDKLGMKLVKTLELPGGRGQHFFLDMGNGVDGIAFFWFPNAPEGIARRLDPQHVRRPDATGRRRRHGDRHDEPHRVRRPGREDRRVPREAAQQGCRRHRDHQPLELARGRPQEATTTPRPTTATCSSARCTSRIRTARCSSSPAGRRRSTSPTSATSRPRPTAYRSPPDRELIGRSAPAADARW